MASYSVNLTNDEWEFVLSELYLRRENDLNDCYLNYAHADDLDCRDDAKRIKKMIDMSKTITKKIQNKNKSKNNSKYSSRTKTELCEKIDELEKEIHQMKLRNREKVKEDKERENEINKHLTEICYLKIQIDKQHEELQQIKNKLKEIISS